MTRSEARKGRAAAGLNAMDLDTPAPTDDRAEHGDSIGGPGPVMQVYLYWRGKIFSAMGGDSRLVRSRLWF